MKWKTNVKTDMWRRNIVVPQLILGQLSNQGWQVGMCGEILCVFTHPANSYLVRMIICVCSSHLVEPKRSLRATSSRNLTCRGLQTWSAYYWFSIWMELFCIDRSQVARLLHDHTWGASYTIAWDPILKRWTKNTSGKLGINRADILCLGRINLPDLSFGYG